MDYKRHRFERPAKASFFISFLPTHKFFNSIFNANAQNNFQQRHALAFLTPTFDTLIKNQKSMEPNIIDLNHQSSTVVELEKTSSKMNLRHVFADRGG